VTLDELKKALSYCRAGDTSCTGCILFTKHHCYLQQEGGLTIPPCYFKSYEESLEAVIELFIDPMKRLIDEVEALDETR
jgi:hypothetical protein